MVVGSFNHDKSKTLESPNPSVCLGERRDSGSSDGRVDVVGPGTRTSKPVPLTGRTLIPSDPRDRGTVGRTARGIFDTGK